MRRLVLLLLLYLCGCASRTTEPNLTPALGRLPAPSAVIRRASADPLLHQVGAARSVSLAQNDLTEWQAVRLQPRYTPATDDFADLAFAAYELNVPAAFTQPPVLHLAWAQAPEPGAQVLLGLANWNADHWDWFTAEDQRTFDLGSITPYRADDGALLAVVIPLSNTDVVLTELWLGDVAPSGRHQLNAAPARYSQLELLDTGGALPALAAVRGTEVGADIRYDAVLFIPRADGTPEWEEQVVFSNPQLNFELELQAAMVDGNPAFALRVLNASGQILYAQAGDAQGRVWNGFQGVLAVPDGELVDLAEVDFNAALLWNDFSVPGSPTPYYVLSRDPAAAAGWRDSVDLSASGLHKAFDLQVIGGIPAVSTYTEDAAPLLKLYVRHANDALGLAWDDPVEAGAGTGNALTPQLALLADGGPAVLYGSSGDLYFRPASDLAGETWAEPSALVTNDNTLGYAFALDGTVPAVGQISSTRDLWLRHSDDNLGQSWTQVTHMDGGIAANAVDLANHDGALVTAWARNGLASTDPSYILIQR
jgi:hypothetical protein